MELLIIILEFIREIRLMILYWEALGSRYQVVAKYKQINEITQRERKESRTGQHQLVRNGRCSRLGGTHV